MTNEQVYIIVGTSMLFNAVLFGLLMAYLNVKFEVMTRSLNERFRGIG